MKVGLVLQTDDDVDVGRHAARFSTLRHLAQQVEAAGFDSLWLYDHLLYRYAGKPAQGTWECWTILALLWRHCIRLWERAASPEPLPVSGRECRPDKRGR